MVWQMLKKTISAVLVLAFLSSAVAIVPCVRLASAQINAVTIQADGSVTPSAAPIQRIGEIYTVTGDVDSISVYRSNLTLDGNGHTVHGIDPNIPSQYTQMNYGGIGLENVQNVTVKGFNLRYCAYGIVLEKCSYINVSGNNITGAWHAFTIDRIVAAIQIRDSNFNLVSDNRVENNLEGIVIWENSQYNTIVGNTITGNTNEGIRLYESSSNAFYHNNFANAKNVYDSGWDHNGRISYNDWDNGKEGNFWNNYNGTDANKDGIGDTVYLVDTHNKDRCPLMAAWNASRLIDTEPPSVSMISPQNITYKNSTIPLQFTTNKPAQQMSYSIDNQQNMTVNGNTTLTDLPNGYHNLTVYATDQYGNTGVSENMNFTIEVEQTAAFPIVPVAVVSATIVAFACLVLFFYFKKRKPEDLRA